MEVVMSEKADEKNGKGQDKKPKKFEIKIDKQHFEVEAQTITGAQLRALPTPDIPADRDLFLDVAGSDPDILIADDRVVELEKHMVFFSAPKTITPGKDAAGR
jgi:hypothetical protein